MTSNIEHARAIGVNLQAARFSTLVRALVGNYNAALDGPSALFFDPNGANRDVVLPAIQPGAGHLYYVANVGTANSLIVKDNAGNTLVTLGIDTSTLLVAQNTTWEFKPTSIYSHTPFGASGANHSIGLVPDPGVTGGTTRFLREDGQWSIPPSGGTGISDAFSFMTDGTNTASGTGTDTFKFRSNDNSITITVTNNDVTHGDNVNLTANEAAIDHDALLNFVGNEHVDHSTVNISAGTGLTGGGSITASRTLSLDINGLTADTPVLADSIAFYDASGADINKATLTAINAILDHDALMNFVANEHVDHSTVSVQAGVALSGGGAITSTVTLNLDISGLTAETTVASGDELIFKDVSGGDTNKITFANFNAALDHDTLAGFVANEHIDHTTVSISAGSGLTGGGTIAANRTISLDINGQTEDVTPAGGDFVITWDVSASGFKKVQLDNLPGGGGGLANVVEDLSPQLGGDLDTNGFHIVISTGEAIRTGTGAGNTALFQAFDVDGAAYVTFATLTANNTPTFDLAAAVTIGGAEIYRVGGTDVALADGGTGTSLSDPGADRLLGWDDSAGLVKFLALADMNTEGAPASGDFLVAYTAEGALVKVDWASLPGAGGGISNVVEDTTPQLGGDLDTNTFNIVFTNGTALRTGQTAGNTFLLQAYDVDGTAYVTFATLTANNTPTMDLASGVTIGGAAIYRAGGTDVAVADGGTGASDASTARTNLGLGSGDSPQFTGIELGHATDTTITRASAGDLNIEGNIVYRAGGTDVALADGGTGTSLSDPGADRLMGWDDSAGLVKFLALADMNTEAAPASGDFLIAYTAEGALVKVDWASLPGGGGGLNNVVEDTTPQLGGDLDLNTFNITGTGSINITDNADFIAKFEHTQDVASVGVLRLDGNRATMAANDEAYVAMYLSDGAGTQTEFARLTWRATDVTDTSEGGALRFSVITAGTLAAELVLDGVSLSPVTSDGLALGTTALMWADLFLASGSVINFNNGDVTLTHAANLLTLAGGDFSIGTAGVFTTGTIELGAASDTTLARSSAGNMSIEGNVVYRAGGTDVPVADGGTGASDAATARANLGVAYGKQSVWVPAAAMTPRTTNGAVPAVLEMTTNDNMFNTLDFDTATQQFAQFNIRMPKSWDEGTVTFIPVWSHPATATNFGVVWSVAAVALSDGDAGDVAFGTEQTSTDTGGTTHDVYQGPESSAITIGGTPAEGDWVMFRVARNVANASDTLAVDARLHGVLLFYTNNNTNDT